MSVSLRKLTPSFTSQYNRYPKVKLEEPPIACRDAFMWVSGEGWLWVCETLPGRGAGLHKRMLSYIGSLTPAQQCHYLRERLEAILNFRNPFLFLFYQFTSVLFTSVGSE